SARLGRCLGSYCFILDVRSLRLSSPHAIAYRLRKKMRPITEPVCLPCFGFPKPHLSAHVLAVSLCPAAHATERSENCPSQLGQRIFNSNGLRLRHMPDDQTRGFEIAKSSGQHALRHASEMAAQLPMATRPIS